MRLALLTRVHADVENIASPKDDVAVVLGRRVSSVLGCSFKDYVHVAVSINHAAAVLDIILQSDADLAVQLLYQEVEWFSGRLQVHH